MAWVPILWGLTVFSVNFHHSEEWTERNQQLLETLSENIRWCAGLWVIGGFFNMEPEAFEQFATPARLPGVLVAPTMPTFRHGASVRRFDYFVVHRATRCQILEVQVLEKSGISPHHPVRLRVKRSFQGLITWVLAVPRALPPPTVGCVREPWRWEIQRERNTDERWEWLMRCTELRQGTGTHGQGSSSQVGDQKGSAAEGAQHARAAQDTGWWRVLCNRLRELWLIEALPTKRAHLPQQPEQVRRLRVHLCRMATQTSSSSWSAEIWRTAMCSYGEAELQDLKDVHWKALTTLDKLHKRDRRTREKELAEFAREASQGAAGLLHRITKPWALWRPREAAQREATNPRHAADFGGEVAGTHLAHTRQRDVASGQAMGSAESRGRKQAATARN